MLVFFFQVVPRIHQLSTAEGIHLSVSDFEMKGWEIAKVLSKSGPVYEALLSVVSIDQIPKNIPLHTFVVCNLRQD